MARALCGVAIAASLMLSACAPRPQFSAHRTADAPDLSIGLLWSDRGDTCVATMLNENEAITAAHCLFDERGRRLSTGAFHLGLASGKSFSIIDARLSDAFDPSRGATVAAMRDDVAFLTLSGLGPASSRIYLGGTASVGDSLLLGRPGSPPKPCSVTRDLGGLMLLDCAIAPGDSGAPAYQRLQSGAIQIIGVVSARESAEGRDTAIISRLPSR